VTYLVSSALWPLCIPRLVVSLFTEVVYIPESGGRYTSKSENYAHDRIGCQKAWFLASSGT
jgi:hypothetical protein